MAHPSQNPFHNFPLPLGERPSLAMTFKALDHLMTTNFSSLVSHLCTTVWAPSAHHSLPPPSFHTHCSSCQDYLPPSPLTSLRPTPTQPSTFLLNVTPSVRLSAPLTTISSPIYTSKDAGTTSSDTSYINIACLPCKPRDHVCFVHCYILIPSPALVSQQMPNKYLLSKIISKLILQSLVFQLIF